MSLSQNPLLLPTPKSSAWCVFAPVKHWTWCRPWLGQHDITGAWQRNRSVVSCYNLKRKEYANRFHCSNSWFSDSFTDFLPHVQEVDRCYGSQTWVIPNLFLCPHLQHQLLNSSFQSCVSSSSLVKISNNFYKRQCCLLIFPHLLARQSRCFSVLFVQ